MNYYPFSISAVPDPYDYDWIFVDEEPTPAPSYPPGIFGTIQRRFFGPPVVPPIIPTVVPITPPTPVTLSVLRPFRRPLPPEIQPLSIDALRPYYPELRTVGPMVLEQ